MKVTLPEFPVDDATLDLLWQAMWPGPEAEMSCVSDLLKLYSEMGGSDTSAVAEVVGECAPGATVIHVMRDPRYHEYNVLSSLITEVRRLRGLLADIEKETHDSAPQ